jgi:SOS regulatory protein LexA
MSNDVKLTDKEKLIYDYISETIKRDGYAPSVRDIKESLGIKSTSTVHSYLERLEKKGYITRESGKSRTLRVETIADQPKRTARIPILSNVTVGSPILAVENFESYIDFPLMNFSYTPATLFAFKMNDDSMKNVGIFKDDIVVLKKQIHADNGDMTAVLLANKAAVRRYYADPENHVVRLHCENPEYDMIIADEDDVVVLGKVISVLRFY